MMPVERLKSFVREASKGGFEAAAPGSCATIGDCPGQLPVLGPMMSLALVASPELRVTLKSHFSASAFTSLMTRLGLSKSAVDVCDFMNEYSNLVAGMIKKSFLEDGLSAGMSLPLALRGFDEIFFPPEDFKTIFVDRWRVRVSLDPSEVQFNCSAMLEIYDPQIFDRLRFKITEPSSVVEWL